MLLLELFSGTGSVGTNAKKRGYKVISVDSNDKTDANIVVDILNWDYKKLKLKPDVVWASPPCGSFSNMAITRDKNSKAPPRVRHISMKPLKEGAVLGDKILKKTIEIINYYRRINPRMKFIMENPHGFMWRSPYMKALKHYTTSNTLYCLYKDKRRKPTDFFNNFELELKSVKNDGNCRATVGVVDVPLCDRYRIPQKLLDDIFTQIKRSK